MQKNMRKFTTINVNNLYILCDIAVYIYILEMTHLYFLDNEHIYITLYLHLVCAKSVNLVCGHPKQRARITLCVAHYIYICHPN